jgi:hypothetical protein
MKIYKTTCEHHPECKWEAEVKSSKIPGLIWTNKFKTYREALVWVIQMKLP